MRNSRLAVVTALFAVALVLALAPAAMAVTKPFSLVVTPSSFSAGATVTATATLTNLTATQQLGSANITAPSGFSIVSASAPAPATTAVAGQVVQVRNASLQPNQSLAVSITVVAPCTPTSSSWSVVANNSDSFNGLPGDNLTLVDSASSLSASVTDSCFLRFVTQPHAARTGQVISGSDYDPTGPALSVEVVGGSGRVTSSSAPITLEIGPTSTGLGALSGTTTVNAANGLASFGDLSIDTAGAYVLLATSPGLTSASSSPFRIDDVAVPCAPGLDCSGSISSNTISADVTASGPGGGNDFLTLSLDNGRRPECSGDADLPPDWVVLDATSPDRTKSATLTIPKALMNAAPNNGAAFLEICYGAPEPFNVKPGTTLEFLQIDINGDGVLDNWYEGLLHACERTFGPPCVSTRKKDRAGNGVITATLPGGNADPHMR